MVSRKVEAVHPDWSGFLSLSSVDRSVVHDGYGSKGTYDVRDGILTIRWESFDPDIFVDISGIYIHQSLLSHLPDVEQLFAVKIGGQPVRASRIHVLVPESNYEVCLRTRTSDLPTFIQVFVNSEFESPHLPDRADVIVDLGANIGLATVYFGAKYPDASLLSVEPDAANFAAMIGNTARLGERVRKVRGAVWTRDGFISLRTEDDRGRPLGEWGIQVAESTEPSDAKVPCYKLSTLLDDAGFRNVDILKIDIEGAELDLFSESAIEWLLRINLIIIETHDRFRPGAEAAVRSSILSRFEELPRSGEHLMFRRR